jgi:hypothetical protein
MTWTIRAPTSISEYKKVSDGKKAEEGESIDIVHGTRKGVHELFV